MVKSVLCSLYVMLRSASSIRRVALMMPRRRLSVSSARSFRLLSCALRISFCSACARRTCFWSTRRAAFHGQIVNVKNKTRPTTLSAENMAKHRINFSFNRGSFCLQLILYARTTGFARRKSFARVVKSPIASKSAGGCLRRKIAASIVVLQFCTQTFGIHSNRSAFLRKFMGPFH
jgi:hypothetical protein